MVLLYLDLLGTRSKWHREGRAGVERAFTLFHENVLNAIKTREPGLVVGGGIESDSAALLCLDEIAATRIGRGAYRNAFERAAQDVSQRQWLRGAIVRVEGNEPLRTEAPCDPSLSGLMNYRYSPWFLDAIAVERSGFKGMRLVIANELVTEELRKHWATKLGKRTFVPVRRLEHCGYPHRLRDGFQDFLWMAAGGSDEWDLNRRRMADRLRYAANEAEEALQAAATQVAFHECAAIRRSLEARAD
jgi:hypothetical protein